MLTFENVDEPPTPPPPHKGEGRQSAGVTP
jgi:hypothetical protein